MIWFGIRSLFTGYGWSFIRHVALPHPIRTLRALRPARRAVGKIDELGSITVTDDAAAEQDARIVGAGFCLKPTDNRCPSKTDLHGCRYLEDNFLLNEGNPPAPCRGCRIGAIGAAALKSGSAFYVMTSAQDILPDVFRPAMERGVFRSGRFLLCRYSFQPFLAGMMAAGISGTLYAFCDGDCRDYKTWLKADRGVKKERTSLTPETQAALEQQIAIEANKRGSITRTERRGNLYYPVYE